MTELDLPAHTIAVAPVGCAVFAYDYLNVDFVEAPHGRAPAVATGIRRVRPEAFVLTYQGDGDLAAIGTAEIVHAAARGERITAIFVNNGIYGMTGGQMAPTTLLGQRTTSSPLGRDAALMGFPIRITEMLAQLPGVTYAARGSIADASLIGKLKVMIKRACLVQIEGGGFSIVEALSNCPIGWEMTPQQSLEHLKGPVVEAYPLGVIVDRWVVSQPAGAGSAVSQPAGAGSAGAGSTAGAGSADAGSAVSQPAGAGSAGAGSAVSQPAGAGSAGDAGPAGAGSTGGAGSVGAGSADGEAPAPGAGAGPEA
jgi:2-oxoglutarate ferredoxin oxidoreductase subunit beta